MSSTLSNWLSEPAREGEERFSLLSRTFHEKPYASLAALRAKSPVCQVDHGWWALSRHADVVYALKHPELFSSADAREDRLVHLDSRLREPILADEVSIIGTDAPAHTRLRKRVAVAFTPTAMSRLEGRIRAIVRQCVDRMIEKEHFDLVADLAIPLPVTVIAELLGIDPSRHADFKRWSDDVINVPVGVEMPEAEVQRILASRQEFRDFFDRLIAERRQAPVDDLISDLCRAEGALDPLTSEELVSLAITLLVAGNVTTTNLIGNGMLALLDHPDTLARLRVQPELVPKLVEEALRYDGPVLFVTRRATEDVTLSGVRIPAGATVLPSLAAANRDPEVFADPDRFDIDRETRGHVAFGFGVHFCVGAPLTRMEARIAFDEILRRMPPFSRSSERAEWRGTMGLRGLRSLPLRLERPASDRDRAA